MTALPADPVVSLVPWATGEGLRLRRALLKARDLATSRLAAAKFDETRSLLRMIVAVASEYALSGASEGQLGDARNQCLRLMLAAGFFEREGAVQ